VVVFRSGVCFSALKVFASPFVSARFLVIHAMKLTFSCCCRYLFASRNCIRLHHRSQPRDFFPQARNDPLQNLAVRVATPSGRRFILLGLTLGDCFGLAAVLSVAELVCKRDELAARLGEQALQRHRASRGCQPRRRRLALPVRFSTIPSVFEQLCELNHCLPSQLVRRSSAVPPWVATFACEAPVGIG